MKNVVDPDQLASLGSQLFGSPLLNFENAAMPKVEYGTLVKNILSLKMPAVVLNGVLRYSNKLVNDRMWVIFRLFFQNICFGTLMTFCLA